MKRTVTLLAVPAELLEEVGINVCNTLEMYEKDGALVIRQLEDCDFCGGCHSCCREC